MKNRYENGLGACSLEATPMNNMRTHTSKQGGEGTKIKNKNTSVTPRPTLRLRLLQRSS